VTEPHWWDDHRNLAMVAEFMQRQGHDFPDIVYMLAKPWKHNDDFNLAVAELNLPPELWNREGTEDR